MKGGLVDSVWCQRQLKLYDVLCCQLVILLLWSGGACHAEVTTGSTSRLPALLVEQLRAGGLVVYWRHAATDHLQRDLAELDFANCRSQRNLSALGRQQASRIGGQMMRRGIQVSQVLTSPYCRCVETAMLAFGHSQTVVELTFSVGVNRQRRSDYSTQLQRWLSQSPPSGSNHVIVSHTANLKDASGIWLKPEGAMAVFKPLAEGFQYLGSISPDDWAALDSPL